MRKPHWTEQWMLFSAIWGLMGTINLITWMFLGGLNPLITTSLSSMFLGMIWGSLILWRKIYKAF